MKLLDAKLVVDLIRADFRLNEAEEQGLDFQFTNMSFLLLPHGGFGV